MASKRLFFRRGTMLVAATAIWILPSIVTVEASTVENTCYPLKFPNFSGGRWDEDTSYEISIRETEDERLRIVVTGDILILDKDRFASLVRDVAHAPGNIAELVLDARLIRIQEPLAFRTAKVSIFAHTLAFEGRGLIALTQAPGTQPDGVEINAWKIDLRTATPIPLQVSVDEDSERSVVIRSGALLTASELPEYLSPEIALWRKSSNFDGTFPEETPPSWSVSIDETGLAAAITAQRGVVSWPSYLAYKVRKHHAFGPFDPGLNSQLTERLDEFFPILETLDEAEALLDLNAVRQLMSQNIDARGLGPAHVPSEDFAAAKTRFDAAINRSERHLKNLASIIVTAHNAPSLDLATVNATRERLRSISQAVERRHLEIGNVFTRLASLESQATEIHGAIEVQRDLSRKVWEDRRRASADLDRIRPATTVLAVGASFIGTPAVGAAIATGVGLAGDLVYAHNAGQPLTTETLVTIGEKNANLYRNAKSARDAWERHKADLANLNDVFAGKEVTPPGLDKPLTKTEAAKRAGSSISAFAGNVKTVADGIGSLPKPDAISLTETEEENQDLLGLMARLADVQRNTSDAIQLLTELQGALIAENAAFAEAKVVEQVLLELNPSNDQEILRWKAAALHLWNRELQSLYHQAMDLRRSLFFETWKAPALPAEIETFPEEITSYMAAGRYNPLEPNATSPTDLTKAHLDAEVTRHLTVLGAIANAIDTTWQAYMAERAAGAQPFFDHAEFSYRDGAPPSTQLFLDQLNAQILRQIRFPATRSGVQFPLLIPFPMTAPPMDIPERLLRAGVANVRFKDATALNGKTLSFNITYRLAGELRQGDRCSYVDLSVPGGAKFTTRRDQAGELAFARSEAEQPLTFESLRHDRTAPPARTLYFLSVTVGGFEEDGNWKNAPEIDGFTFWRRIVQ